MGAEDDRRDRRSRSGQERVSTRGKLRPGCEEGLARAGFGEFRVMHPPGRFARWRGISAIILHRLLEIAVVEDHVRGLPPELQAHWDEQLQAFKRHVEEKQ